VRKKPLPPTEPFLTGLLPRTAGWGVSDPGGVRGCWPRTSACGEVTPACTLQLSPAWTDRRQPAPPAPSEGAALEANALLNCLSWKLLAACRHG